MSEYDGPRRRLRLDLNLEADDLDALASALRSIADDLVLVRDEKRLVTSGGFSSGYHLALDCDPEMNGVRYRFELAEWHRRAGLDGAS